MAYSAEEHTESATATFWFYRTLGEEFGPVTETALREVIHASQLAQDEEVRAADSDEWMTVTYFDANYLESATAQDLDSMLIVDEEPEATPDRTEQLELPEIVPPA